MIRDNHPELEVELDKRLKYIGYWDSDEGPLDYADSAWESSEREAVLRYLETGKILYFWPTPWICRICGKENGSRCLSDGTWVWPAGLAHYIMRHAIRLPQSFVDHVMSQEDVRRYSSILPEKIGEGKIRAIIELIGGDPDKEVASLERMRDIHPKLEEVREMVSRRELLIMVHMQEIVKSVCGVINYMGENFDPDLMRGIVVTAVDMAANEEEAWARYVNEDAALVNLRIINNNLPPSGEYDA